MSEGGGLRTGGTRLKGRCIPAILLLLVVTGTLSTAPYISANRESKGSDQEEHTLELSGKAWNLLNKPTINVLIIPSPTLQGWRDSYVEDAKQAFTDWVICTRIFTASYGYSYLSEISFNVSVAEYGQTEVNDYDVTLSWSNQLSFAEATGATILYSKPTGQITKATITLPVSITKNGEEYYLSDDDVRNILVDEIGHTLGLEHSNIKGDALNESYDFTQKIICHSSLDIYGLAVTYGYLATGSFEPTSRSTITLQNTGIPYQFMRSSM